ncbi:hypothetical protein HAX54_036966, partial [Datura stramonium]|nr:hypothetical protein [Datura stramonium]
YVTSIMRTGHYSGQAAQGLAQGAITSATKPGVTCRKQQEARCVRVLAHPGA